MSFSGVNHMRIAERVQPISVEYTDTHVMITLEDNRIIGIPYDLVVFLRDATDEQRNDYRLTSYSVIYDSLDDGIDIAAFASGKYRIAKVQHHAD